MRLTVPITADPARVRELLAEQAAAAPNRMEERPQPVVRVAELGVDGAVYSVGVWVDDPILERRTAGWLRERCLARLLAEGLLTEPEDLQRMTPDDPRNRDRFDRSYDDAIGIVSARRRKRRATNRRRHNRSLIASFLVVLGIVFVALTVGGAAGAGVAAYSVVDGLDLNTMTPDYPGVNSKIYASNGALL